MKTPTATSVNSDESNTEFQPPTSRQEDEATSPDPNVPAGEQPHQNLLDDIFGSAPPSPSEAHTNLHLHDDPSEIPRLRRIHHTDGYREGFAQGKESQIQAGFDEGYSLGAEMGLRAGWCLGVLEGLSAGAIMRMEGDDEPSTGGQSSQGGGVDVRELLRKAEEELSMERFFGAEFFAEDGVWLFDVSRPISGGEQGSERDNEGSVTFADVAAAHPLVKKWEGVVKELAETFSLEI